MGLLDSLRGIKRPEEGVAPVSRAELEQRLLALDHEQLPFRVQSAEGQDDLVAEWKIVDASWYEIFAKAGLEKSHRIRLRFDEGDHEVRAVEESWDVEWRAGVPSLSLTAEKFRGRTFASKSFGKGWAFRGPDPRSFGEVYEYRFDVSEMKDPIVETILAAGWTFKPAM